jgi:nicotinamide-nucleotide amidase
MAYLPGLEGVDLRLSAWGFPPDEADRRLSAAAAMVRHRGGESVYGEGDADLAALVLERARAHGVRLAVAESCTGGLVGARLTEIPGSSDVFVGGVIAYDNELKQNLLAVPGALIAEHGAVSEPVARAMVAGAVTRFGVRGAVAVTGVAGPGGGSPEKPVGTVWLATQLDGEVLSHRSMFPGSRHEVRARAAQAALLLLYRRLDPQVSNRRFIGQ